MTFFFLGDVGMGLIHCIFPHAAKIIPRAFGNVIVAAIGIIRIVAVGGSIIGGVVAAVGGISIIFPQKRPTPPCLRSPIPRSPRGLILIERLYVQFVGLLGRAGILFDDVILQ